MDQQTVMMVGAAALFFMHQNGGLDLSGLTNDPMMLMLAAGAAFLFMQQQGGANPLEGILSNVQNSQMGEMLMLMVGACVALRMVNA